MRKPNKQPQAKFIGELPEGDWTFCLVTILGRTDALVLVEKTGRETPRVIIGDKLTEIV